MISIEHLSKSFSDKNGKLDVLKDISVEIPDEGITVIVGKSGSGKTTFLNALGGLETYDGTISYKDGRVERGKSSPSFDGYRSLHIGYIFQNFLLFGEEKVEENVGKSLDIAGIVDASEKKKRVQSALKAVGLWLYRRRKASDLSLGQKQRVAIARAIAIDPDVLLADEPTGNLDSENARAVMEILKVLSKRIPVVCVTHNDALSYLYGDRFFFMKDGKLSQGRREDLEVSQEVKDEASGLERRAPKASKPTVVDRIESFKILVIDGLKRIVLPKDYSPISEEMAKKAMDAQNQAEREEESAEAVRFDTSSFDESKKNKGAAKLFGKRKHKGQRIVGLLSFAMAVLLTFGVNAAYLYESYLFNSVYAYSGSAVGAIYEDEGTIDSLTNPITARRQVELMNDPESGISQFLNQNMRIAPLNLIATATAPFNRMKAVSDPGFLSPTIYFLSDEAVSDSFALRGDKPSSLKEGEVIMDESLLEILSRFSKFGDKKENYIDTIVSIDGSDAPQKQYRIAGFAKTNLPAFIFKASPAEVNRGISSYRSVYASALQALDNLSIDTTSTGSFPYYLSKDLFDSFLLYSNRYAGYPPIGLGGFATENYLPLQEMLTINNDFPNLGNLQTTPSIAASSTLFIDVARVANDPTLREEVSNFLRFLIQPEYRLSDLGPLGSSRERSYFRHEVYSLSSAVTPASRANPQSDVPNMIVRKDIYDLLTIQLSPSSDAFGFISGTYEGQGSLSYFASEDDLAMSLLSTAYPQRPFYDVVDKTYPATVNTAIFLSKDMTKAKALSHVEGYPVQTFDEVIDDIASERNVGPTTLSVTFALSTLLLLLYGLIYRSDMLVDSEKIGIYRCLGVKKSRLLFHYAALIAKKITFSFLIPYAIFAIAVSLLYEVFAPVYVLIAIPFAVYALGLGIGLLPTVLTLRKEPRSLVKLNVA